MSIQPPDRGHVQPTHPGRLGPEDPALDLLDAMLERYEAVAPERDEAEVMSDRREQFLTEFRSLVETTVRIVFEEVAWRLQQRGHHAWLTGESTEGAEAGERDSVTLAMLPIGYVPEVDEASTLTVAADPDQELVIVEEHIGGTARREVPVGTFTVGQLDAESLSVLGAELVRRSFAVYPPLPTKEALDPSIARE